MQISDYQKLHLLLRKAVSEGLASDLPSVSLYHCSALDAAVVRTINRLIREEIRHDNEN